MFKEFRKLAKFAPIIEILFRLLREHRDEIIDWLQEQADKTETTFDDELVELLDEFLAD